jgi:hypothetical protein
MISTARGASQLVLVVAASFIPSLEPVQPARSLVDEFCPVTCTAAVIPYQSDSDWYVAYSVTQSGSASYTCSPCVKPCKAWVEVANEAVTTTHVAWRLGGFTGGDDQPQETWCAGDVSTTCDSSATGHIHGSVGASHAGADLYCTCPP